MNDSFPRAAVRASCLGLAALLGLVACGDGGGTGICLTTSFPVERDGLCYPEGCDDGTTVAILDPVSMQEITSADDADPDESLIQYVFVIEARCMTEEELVELYILEPAMSLYGGGAVDDMSIWRSGPTTLIPGANRFVARTTVSMTESAEVSVDVGF
ncbi:MAG: hypothetical protein AB7S26_06780 [Sandaracinaceae bacterium]